MCLWHHLLAGALNSRQPCAALGVFPAHDHEAEAVRAVHWADCDVLCYASTCERGGGSRPLVRLLGRKRKSKLAGVCARGCLLLPCLSRHLLAPQQLQLGHGRPFHLDARHWVVVHLSCAQGSRSYSSGCAPVPAAADHSTAAGRRLRPVWVACCMASMFQRSVPPPPR